jgi:hypothetical protein
MAFSLLVSLDFAIADAVQALGIAIASWNRIVERSFRISVGKGES